MEPQYEWRSNSYLGEWRPLDLKAMRMSAQGERKFLQFSRLLKPGRPARKFNFVRYQPRIGTGNSTISYEVRRVS